MLSNRLPSDTLLELGRRLWNSNHTFRARLEEWRDVLGANPEQLLMQQAGTNPILALATAVAIWRTCKHWSLSPPQTAMQWSGWPLAGLVGDGLISESLAVAVLKGRSAPQDLVASLTSVVRLPAQQHPWLDQQQTYLPELTDLNNPLSGPNSNANIRLPWTPDIVLTIGSSASQSPMMAAQEVVLNPAAGPQAVDLALSELWHAGINIDWRPLGERPCLDLPSISFHAAELLARAFAAR